MLFIFSLVMNDPSLSNQNFISELWLLKEPKKGGCMHTSDPMSINSMS